MLKTSNSIYFVHEYQPTTSLREYMKVRNLKFVESKLFLIIIKNSNFPGLYYKYSNTFMVKIFRMDPWIQKVSWWIREENPFSLIIKNQLYSRKIKTNKYRLHRTQGNKKLTNIYLRTFFMLESSYLRFFSLAVFVTNFISLPKTHRRKFT